MKSVVKWLIDVCFRPPRHEYDTERTAVAVTTGETVYVRQTMKFTNSKGNQLEGSLWYDKDYEIPKNCLIYLHSLGSNQFEALNLVAFMCSRDLAVFSFDFSGCGNSEGNYIPLDGSGIDDVNSCLKILEEQYNFAKYAVWGRSMGAAIALHAASETDKFVCCISDSAFKDTESVVYDQASQNGIPAFVIPIIKRFVANQALKTLGTDVISPYPYASLHKSNTPLLIGHGKQDSFITVSQAKDIFERYGCDDKTIYVFDGCHNTGRPCQWYEYASRFIHRKLGLDPVKRFYDNTISASDIHSGNKGVVLFDIDCVIQEARQARKRYMKITDDVCTRSDTSTDLKTA